MLKALLITGGGGNVGRALRPLLKDIAETVVLSGRGEIRDLQPHERFVRCDLADGPAVDALLTGIDGVIHLAGASTEGPFDQVLQANIIGQYNLYEAARRNGKPRIVFASSNHTVGFYKRDQRIDSNAPPRPDSLYGVSKVFGEALASLYFDKFGVETLSVRIGSCAEEPTVPRMLSTWFSYPDLASLCVRAFSVPQLGHTVVFGASANDEGWWDNRNAAFLGWEPVDNAARWREAIMASAPPVDPNDTAALHQGGRYTTAGHPDDA